MELFRIQRDAWRPVAEVNQHKAATDTRRAIMFIVLFLIAVPWYWRFFEHAANSVVFGIPVWFVTSVLGSALISAAAAWCFRVPWPDEVERQSTDD